MTDTNVPTPSPADVPGSTPVATTSQPRNDPKQARRENLRQLLRRPSFLIGMFIVLVWTTCALFSNALAPHNPNDFRTKPHLSPRWGFPFGTDRTGRDVFSRVIAGAREVLKIAPAAALIGVVLGVIIGLIMGYFGGWFDNVFGRIIEAFLALPVVLLALLAIVTLGTSTLVVLGVIATLFTPVVARTVRAAVLAERDLDYVTSAKLRGESSAFIMFREILPNVTGPIIVELTVRIGYAVFTVATLSFLGAGPPPPSPDWGAQVSENYRLINSGYWWPTLFPALAIATLVIAVSLIADSVQSVLEGS